MHTNSISFLILWSMYIIKIYTTNNWNNAEITFNKCQSEIVTWRVSENSFTSATGGKILSILSIQRTRFLQGFQAGINEKKGSNESFVPPSLDVAKSLTRPEVGTKGNFCTCYRRIRAPFLVIINELIPKINDMVVPSSQRTSNKDEKRAALNEKCQAYIKNI